ncbi:MAG: 2-oxo acid dehydrogenase subunit E2 [Deltaproteobacteria bacterium]|nr:2-oxo acid dehydrogenase subunit E2 [Deltaproteobacteria bacterium]
MPNLQLEPKQNLSSFRKIALGTWKTAYDPSVYGSMDLDVTETMEYIEQFRAKTGRKLTVTHLLARTAGAVMEEMPDANSILRWGRLYVRKQVGVFFQVAMEDPETGEIDLSGATVHDPEKMSIVELMDAFDSQVKKVRKGEDEKLESSRNLFRSLPWFLVWPILNLIGFLGYTLNLDLRLLGVPKDAFGSLMITNIGSLGLSEAYVPLVPYSRIPLLLAVGEVKDRAVVVDGEIAIRKIMRISATFDHRVLDGMHASVMARVMRQWMEHPFEHFDPIDDLSAEPAQLEAAEGEGA